MPASWQWVPHEARRLGRKEDEQTMGQSIQAVGEKGVYSLKAVVLNPAGGQHGQVARHSRILAAGQSTYHQMGVRGLQTLVLLRGLP